MKNKIHELYALEQLSGGNTCIHRLHPTVKLATSAVFIFVVISFDRYAFGQMVPYIFYPTLLMAFSETPYLMLLKRFLIALPFCLFAGITNAVLNHSPAFEIGGLTVSYGVVSLFTVVLRTYLCVMAVLLLISSTPFSELTGEMRRLKLPNIFIAIFEMTYRYIGVLSDEAYSMYVAYSLRSYGKSKKGIDIKDMGSFIGQLLLRSIDRAERIYNAMKCRGYASYSVPHSGRKLTRGDIIYSVTVCISFIFFRFFDIYSLFIETSRGAV